MSKPRTKPAAARVTDHDVRVALRKRFAAGAGWGLLEEVRNSTGHARVVRTADAIAIGLWPSRGMEIHGVEIKVARHDWVRELNAPEKAEEIARFCDRFWLAIGDESIVRDGELPPAWGLLVLKGGALVTAKEAERTEAQPLTRTFVAAMLRRAAETEAAIKASHVAPEEVAARIEAALARDDEAKRRQWEHENAAELVELRWKLAWAKHFQTETGIDPEERWRWGDIRHLVEALRVTQGREVAGGGRRLLTPTQVIARDLEQHEKTLRDAIEKVAAARASLAPIADEGSDAA